MTGEHSNVTFCSKNIQIFTLLQVMLFFSTLLGFSNQSYTEGKNKRGVKIIVNKMRSNLEITVTHTWALLALAVFAGSSTQLLN